MQPPLRPLVDVVVVNYRSYEELTRCLSSLEPIRSRFASATIVDQESDAASATAVARTFPWVTVLQRRCNEGFAKGINAGAAIGRAPFLLLLNPDCVGDADFVAPLVDFAIQRPDAAVVGPRILNSDGSIQGSARRFPGWSTFIAGRSSWLTRRFPRNPLSRWNLPGLEDNTVTSTVDWVSGACMLVRRDAFEQAGGMDERFFLYWEDADLCKRLGVQGWRTMYLPEAHVVHVGGRSSVHAYRESLAAFHTSALTLFRKHARWPARWLTPLLYLLLQARLRALLYIHRDRLRTARLPPRDRSSHR